jgi:hypothetical protein
MNENAPGADRLADKPVVCRRFGRPLVAFGAAVDLLRMHKPFSEAKFGTYAAVLRGQIARQHYVFAVQGERAVGYAGWALCSEEIARAWTERRYTPAYAECLAGDSWVGLTYYARSRQITFALMGHIKKRYPGYRIFGLRRYEDGRERFLHTGPRPAGGLPPAD